MQTIEIAGFKVGEGLPHLVIAGPCVIEDAGLVMETAKELKKITGDLKLPFIFKSSYDKANNRKSTRLNSSHLGISYAVFCLKKKTKHVIRVDRRSVTTT